MTSDISENNIVSSISSRKQSISSDMAAKRNTNVRPDSSSSNIGSNENGIETGYSSDNSSIAVNAANRRGDDRESAILRKKPRCENKNALNARLNREKKKEHMQGLEHQLKVLEKENFRLKDEKKRDTEIILKLEEDVNYFKSVVANLKDIGKLLRCVPSSDEPRMSSGSFTNSVSELPFDTGLLGDPFLSSTALKELSQDLVEQNISVESVEELTEERSNLGICLHVAKGRTMLQLCVQCNNSAAALWNDQIG